MLILFMVGAALTVVFIAVLAGTSLLAVARHVWERPGDLFVACVYGAYAALALWALGLLFQAQMADPVLAVVAATWACTYLVVAAYGGMARAAGGGRLSMDNPKGPPNRTLRIPSRLSMDNRRAHRRPRS